MSKITLSYNGKFIEFKIYYIILKKEFKGF